MRARWLVVPALIVTALGVHLGSAPGSEDESSGTLVVTIEGFRNATGHARVALFNRDAGFPDEESAAYRTAVTVIQNGHTEVRFDNLPLSDYAVSMYHDENDDDTLNKGRFGIPKEGYGVSNNVVHALRAPKFDEA